ncbi:hypothetical protein ISX56_29830, partial [Serratia ureilytica]|nr:hypothetical protein [Serratia ureilytica]
ARRDINKLNEIGKLRKARNGEIDPVAGRDEEIRQIVDILMRRRQNNPLLVGESGVGKTAIAEGLAWRIVQGDVPEVMADCTLYSLDIGSLLAGILFIIEEMRPQFR